MYMWRWQITHGKMQMFYLRNEEINGKVLELSGKLEYAYEIEQNTRNIFVTYL